MFLLCFRLFLLLFIIYIEKDKDLTTDNYVAKFYVGIDDWTHALS